MRKLLALLIIPAFLVSCGDDDSPSNTALNLTINGLEDLGATAQYEGWIIVNGSPISTGTFTVDGNGTPSSTSFAANAEDVAAATKFVITIEPIPDPDPAPADAKIVAGDFNGSTSAALSTGVAPAVGDFSAAAGTLFLRTPTDEMTGAGNNGNDIYGVWFGTPGMPPTPNFTLPVLPAGWAYEGWVIGETGPISTGTFTNTVDAPRDSGNPFSGTEFNVGPPIPGEDFFNAAPAGETFPLDIRGRRVVISVEPIPDNSPAPFLLKPLLVDLATDAATAPTSHTFGQNLGSIPTGTVTRQ